MDWHCAVNTLCVVKSWWKSNSFCRAWRPSFGAQEKSSGRIRRDSAESGSWLWTSDIAARSASGLTMSLGGAEDIYTFGVNKCNQSVDKFQHKCWRRDRDSNPGYPLRYTRFPSVRLQPLGHLSAEVGTGRLRLF